MTHSDQRQELMRISEGAGRAELRAGSDVQQPSAEEYRALFKLAAVAKLQADPRTGRLLRVNHKMCELTGYSEPELLAMTLYDLAPAEDHERDRQNLESLLAEREREFQVEQRYLRKDGAPLWAHVHISLIHDAAGRPWRALALVQDVTDRRQVEAALQEQTRMLTTLNRTNMTLAAELDLDKLVQSIVDAARELTGAQFGAFFYNVTGDTGQAYMLYVLSGAPRSAFEGFPMPRNTAIFAPTFAGEQVVRLDDVTQDPRYGGNAPYHGMPAGHLPVRSYLAAPVVSRSGEVFGGLFFGHGEPARFTSEHEHLVSGIAAQAAIAIDNARLFRSRQESEALFRSTFENAAVGIAHGDPDGRWLYVNDHLCRMVGYTREELLASRYQDITYPDDLQLELDYVRQVLNGERDTYFIEKRYVCRDGSLIWIALTVSALNDPVSGKPQRFIKVITEITDRKRAEHSLRDVNRELLEKNQEMEQFVYTVSHDLKSPVVTATGFLGLLKEDLAAGRIDDVQDSLQRLERATARMSQLIDDLLQLSRIGRVPQQLRQVAVLDLVRELRAELYERLEEVGAKLEIAPDLPPVYADRSRLVEIFENLLTNAMKYGCSGPDPRIQIGGYFQDGETRYFVRDNGPGIDPRYHQKIYGLFQRLDTNCEGTGVGLAIVVRVMQMHGGRTWVESRPGQGATFWVAFPSRTLRVTDSTSSPRATDSWHSGQGPLGQVS